MATDPRRRRPRFAGGSAGAAPEMQPPTAPGAPSGTAPPAPQPPILPAQPPAPAPQVTADAILPAVPANPLPSPSAGHQPPPHAPAPTQPAAPQVPAAIEPPPLYRRNFRFQRHNPPPSHVRLLQWWKIPVRPQNLTRRHRCRRNPLLSPPLRRTPPHKLLPRTSQSRSPLPNPLRLLLPDLRQTTLPTTLRRHHALIAIRLALGWVCVQCRQIKKRLCTPSIPTACLGLITPTPLTEVIQDLDRCRHAIPTSFAPSPVLTKPSPKRQTLLLPHLHRNQHSQCPTHTPTAGPLFNRSRIHRFHPRPSRLPLSSHPHLPIRMRRVPLGRSNRLRLLRTPIGRSRLITFRRMRRVFTGAVP